MKITTLFTLALIGIFSLQTPASAVEKTGADANVSANNDKPSFDRKAKRNLAKIFNEKLTDAEGKPVKFDNYTQAKYTLVYFSAHWCSPCRAFTPELVKFFEANNKKGKLQVILASSDQTKEDMEKYMKSAKMPWGGFLEKGADIGDIGDEITGIPRYRVFDKNGHVVLYSNDHGLEGGLAVLKKML